MIVVAAPGQGSQSQGFLAPWLEVDGVRELLGNLGEAAKVDLITHGTVSDDDTIRDTKIAQPLIVAASVVTGGLLLAGRRDRVGALAGHSVGEFAAAALAGILRDEDALALVGVRGRAMADEAAKIETGMSALLGGEADDITARLDDLGLFPANMNGGGQVVVAGAKDALAALAENPPTGARVIPLSVAGAFHTTYMGGAVETLRAAAADVTATDPTLPIYTNKDGSRVTSGSAYVDVLVGQVSNPVRWDLCMESFATDGVTGVIELAPAGALVGLVKRAIKGTPTVAIKTPDDLPAAIELLEAS
ncbi:MAG: S-malonyltransferase [Actinomycetota bacterium]|jgi:[acyl-carrier-protein] S-malonyltransferase